MEALPFEARVDVVVRGDECTNAVRARTAAHRVLVRVEEAAWDDRDAPAPAPARCSAAFAAPPRCSLVDEPETDVAAR